MKYFAVFALLCCLFGVVVAQVKNPICAEELGVVGVCRGRILNWTYRQDTNECIEFYYSGCRGNQNRFDTKEQCEQSCKN